MNDGSVRFYLRLCPDIFLEALHFGTRPQLARLETIGRQFERYVNGGSFNECPLLILNLDLEA